MKNKALLAMLLVAALTLIGAPSHALTKPIPNRNLTSSTGYLPQKSTTTPSSVSYVVVPHPDDEWQTWSLVENSPANYKVFISATRGDQSGYCDTPHPSPFPPTPLPAGKWSPECDDARLNSWLKFFTSMSAVDPTIPGDWAAYVDVGPLPKRGFSLKVDDGGHVYDADRMARVWVDKQGRGAAISFDLGDGDLTAAEVQWALESVRDNRGILGLNTTLPNWNVVGSFRNSASPSCAVYNHPDHTAVHTALWNINFGFNGYNTAATCATDSDAARTKVVSEASTAAAWSTTGAFKMAYGWLGTYALSQDQSLLFMRTQSFWQRY